MPTKTLNEQASESSVGRISQRASQTAFKQFTSAGFQNKKIPLIFHRCLAGVF